MGAQLSLLTPTLSTVALQSYIDIIPNVQYSSTITSSRFLKTVKGLDANGFVVIKFFIKPNNEPPQLIGVLDYAELLALVEKQQLKLMLIPNTLPYSKVIETERANYLLRPFIKNNLFDRLSIRPFLHKFEKNWICFQLLMALKDCHLQKVYHGDLKTENILITSWNWCLILDFEMFKPVVLPENSSQFSFYFDISKRNSCYLAPERFSDEASLNERSALSVLTPQMDLFSLGCCIAELYLDGSSIFTLSQLFKYKRGEYDPNLNNIDDPQVQLLIRDLIQLDPSRRLTLEQLLLKYQDSLFPKDFSTKLYPFIKDLTCYSTPNLKTQRDRFQECDYRIEKVYDNFSELIPRRDRPVDEVQSSDNIHKPIPKPIPVTLSLPNLPNYQPMPISKASLHPQLLIILSVVLSLVRNTTHSSFRIKSCDLIIALLESLTDELKLDRCLPYLVYLLEDPCSDVKIAALRAITQLLYMCESVTAVNILIWPEYILPKLIQFVGQIKEDDLLVKLHLATLLPYLMSLASKFEELIGVLQSSNNRLIAANRVPTQISGSGYASGSNSVYASGSNPSSSTSKEFENFILNLLTDQNSNVKIALLQNISEVCQYFGKQKTNDLVLSHLITYLNDKNPFLRVSFIDSILPLSMFTGILSFEQYILPLLVQTISDPDELVVCKILQTFNHLVNLGFMSDLKIWDLVRTVVKLLLHPNEWIRKHTLILMVSICSHLSLLDLYCILYPIIRPFFQYDVTVFSVDSLYPCLSRPLSRSVYKLLITWAQQHQSSNSKSLFWQRQNNPTIDSFGNSGMSFMVKTRTNNYQFNNSHVITNNHEIPMSLDDKAWLLKLNHSGLPELDLWKLATMRDYIFRISKLSSKNFPSDAGLNNAHVDLQTNGVLPKTLFFDVVHKSDIVLPVNSPRLSSSSSSTAHLRSKKSQSPTPPVNLLSIARSDQDLFGRSVSPSSSLQHQMLLLGGKMTKAAPSIHEDKGNAFAFTNDLDHITSGALDIRINDTHDDLISGGTEEAYNNDDSTTDNILAGHITTKIQHNYKGKNPYILKFLSEFTFEPTLDDYMEFGPAISTESRYNTKDNKYDGAVSDPSKLNWIPKGVLVAHLTEHKASCNCCCVSADNNYFVTGDNDGILKIWDSLRLERNVTGNSSLTLNLGSAIKSMAFVPDRDCIAVALKNGMIKIFKVVFELNGKNRFHDLLLIREYRLVDEYATHIDISKDLLVMITTGSRIVGVDIRSVKEVFLLQNDLSHGLITSFVIDSKNSWVLCLTNHGFLDLWDIRFEINLKKIFFNKLGKISRLPPDVKRSDRNKLVLFISNEDNSVTLIDVSKLNQSSSSSIQQQQQQQHQQLSALSSMQSNQLEFVRLGKRGSFMISTSGSNDLIYWNLKNLNESKFLLRQDLKIVADESQTNNDNFTKYSFKQVKLNPNDEKLKKINRYQMSTRSWDLINDIKFIQGPYEMIIVVDRSGCINVYR